MLKGLKECVTLKLHVIYLPTANHLETVLEINWMCYFFLLAAYAVLI